MTATLSFAPRAIIIGGSTSGLLIGALLRRRGWHIDVFERSPVELAGRGAGIVCHPELFHALDESGAGTDAIGIDVAERIAFDDNGSIIGRLAFPQTVTSWDRLYQLVRKLVPDSHYHLDHALLGVEQDADGVRATFTNGRQVAGELLVGADGFRSTVRQQFLFQQSRPSMQATRYGAVWQRRPRCVLTSETSCSNGSRFTSRRVQRFSDIRSPA